MASKVTIPDLLITLPGIIIVIFWLKKTSFGTKALVQTKNRRNNMPFYLPFIPLLIWIAVFTIQIIIKEQFNLPEYQSDYLDNLFYCTSATVGMVVIIFLAKNHFARGLKGLGVKITNITRDFGFALLNLIAIYALVAAMVLLTLIIGKITVGPDFVISKHQQLQVLTKHHQIPLIILVFITTIFVMPVFEEMLFRGMLQSMLRSYLADRALYKQQTNNTSSNFLSKPKANDNKKNNSRSVWLSILITSGLFTAMHANKWQWPALFTLAVCIGYSYEKSGSLLRPIFIHALFNATNVTFVLLSS